ncbi:phage tail tape measure protein [Staphylococcus felis]|uniref:phage tail tape measure protein n=1 Tax=Staphylococcus felis TaxID=46127 RepID=UPI000E2684F1|nr:phage tail tape measure protein [Staphylococcus felis]REH78439.1 phage tail tape measure protein [Staphylococcus felis]
MAERIKGLQIDLSMQDMGIGSTLAGIKRSFKQLNSDLKLSSNNFKYSEKSMTSYKNRIRELDAATKQQRNNVKELRKQYEQMVKDKGANNAAAVRLRTEYNKQADTLNRLEHELEQTVDGFKRFQKEAQEAARVSNSSFGRLGQKFTDIGPKLTSVGESMKSVGRSMSMYVTAPVVAGFGLAAKKSIDFDDSMRKVKATSGATGKEFNLLRDKALEMGAKTKFSASQSAEALQYMSLAGWDTKDMLNGIDGVMQLAAASGEDLGQVSDIVTDGLSAFGLKAKDSSHFADVLAQTSSKANTDVSGLGEAFKYVAPVAGSFGFSVEDTSIALGLMANSGVKASQAGTALKSMMTKLAKPTGEAKKTMESLGISITDSEGKMLPFRNIMDQLRGSLGGLSKAQQSAAVKTLFGQEAMSGILPIINASDEDYQKLTKSIDNSAGASKRMSDEMEGGIGGSIRKMKSAIESMAISIGDVLAPHIRRAADFIAMLADKFTSMPGWAKTAVVGFGVFAAVLGPLILTTGMFTAALGSIMGTLGPLMTEIVKAGGVMNFLGTKAPFAAKGLTLVGGAFKFMLGPVGLAIAAIVAIGTAFVIAYKKSETFRNIVHTVIDPVVNAFKNLWNTAKEIFNGIWTFIKFVWNGIKNAISNAVKFIFNAVKRYFTAVKNTTSTIFNAVKSYISKLWTGIKNIVSSIVRSLWSSVKNTWNTLYSGTRGIFNKVKSWITNLWNSIKRTVSKIASNLWSSIKRTWNYLWSGTRNIFNRVKNSIVNVWNSIKRSVTGIASSLWNGVRRIFTNMSNGLRGIIGRIKGHIGGMISKIKSGLNSLIRGLNWVGSKLSLPKIPTLSTGTVHNQQINRSVKTTSDGRMKQDTMAIVGDKGPGNGKGRDGRRELIQYPNGRTALTPAKDTPTIIPKGGRVISGGIRQQMANSGTLPKLNAGTWFSKAGSWIGSKMRSAGDWLKDRLGDVLDFVGKPSKLLNKLLSSLGIDFGSLTKGMGIVGQITRGAWNKIKDGAIKWLKGGLDSAGGDIKGGILDPRLINYHFGHTAAYTAATGRPFHEGVDFPFVYKTIRTPMGGKVARQSFMHGGYGNWVKVISGAMEMIFAHLRDFSKTPPSGKTVKAGDVIGLTGNTGFSTGPHLHFGIRKNGRDVDPEPYLWRAQRQGRLKVSGKGGGGLGRIAETVKTALNQTGLPTTKRFVDFWSKKINEKDGTGLLDISKSTFNAFKAKGHDKYNNTLDNLMAGMRYAKVNYGSSLLDKAKRFASGGFIKNSGWYNLAEGGYPEYVISTDPALYSDSMKLLALAAQDIDSGKTSGNKRPGQLPRINSNDNTELLLKMIENQQQQINVLMEIARSNQVVSEKDFELVVDDDSFERRHNRYQDKRERRERKSNMYRGGAFAT